MSERRRREKARKARRRRRLYENGDLALCRYVAYLGTVRHMVSGCDDSEARAALLSTIDTLTAIATGAA